MKKAYEESKKPKALVEVEPESSDESSFIKKLDASKMSIGQSKPPL